ncbi:hypothetical protein CK203_102812 [Vitis vinifera]|uniref:Uncharacterized protein n=1 Tax=Vitis vinifera TaxID=29760 RepID=A0A438F6N2_VITVI|nr:hypothetical protein CK203_102812 [Vitis vinifera]
MSSIGTSKGILEIGKFALYVSIPIGLMYTLANNSENMKKLIQMESDQIESAYPPAKRILEALRELMANSKDRENKEIKSRSKTG